jgi:hypothetical protein
MSSSLRRLRNVGLAVFLLGALGVPGFSLLAPGEDHWKQVVRVLLLISGFLGVGLYGFAVYKLSREK